MAEHVSWERRALLQGMAVAVAGAWAPASLAAETRQPLLKPIPSTGERLPVLGLGSWITFNVGDDPELREECAAVIQAFFQAGGRLIDSSPMYGSSQEVIGHGLSKLGMPNSLF